MSSKLRHWGFSLRHSGWVLAAVAAGCLGHDDIVTEATRANVTPATPGSGGTAPIQEFTGKVNSDPELTLEVTIDPAAPPMLPAPMTCGAGTPLVSRITPGYTEPAKPEVAQLVQKLTINDKVLQLVGLAKNPEGAGNGNPAHYRDIERSEDTKESSQVVRGYQYRDAGRGVNLVAGQPNSRPTLGKDYSTTFPCESVRAASWDVNMEFDVGVALGDETMASLNNMMLAPCMNIIRHPYWGRTQETYSEDMYHTGRMASALTAGIQTHVVACAKHYAANNIEDGRNNQNAVMSEQTLREVYSRHFEMVSREGGIGCVMASYNLINGTKSTQNHHLLTDVLRTDIGFRGLVISDWWAMPGDQAPPDTATAATLARQALHAGMDLEVPWPLHYSALAQLAETEPAVRADLDVAVGRVLEQKARFGSLFTTQGFGLGKAITKLEGDSIVNNEQHIALAEEVEIRSAVLLKNGSEAAPILPITPEKVKSIAVVGLDLKFDVAVYTEVPPSGPILHMATDVNVGDRGSSRVNPDPAKSVGPFAGIQNIAAKHEVTNVTSGNSAAAAKDADLIVVMVGLTASDEGEEYSIPVRDTGNSHGDRVSLDLPLGQNEFVAEVLKLNKPTVIVVQSGSLVNLPWLDDANQQQATVWAGYGGQRVGLALGKLFFGDRNFSGKMPLAWAKQDQLPPFRGSKTGSPFDTDMDYFFGYRYYDMKDIKTLFPFGHGLSYSKFKYSNLNVPCGDVAKDGIVNVTVDIENESAVPGEEVAMLFVAGPPKAASITGERPVKELKSFYKVKLAAKGSAGSVKRVTLPLRVQDLRHWEGKEDGKWVIDEGMYSLMVGPNGNTETALKATLPIHN